MPRARKVLKILIVIGIIGAAVTVLWPVGQEGGGSPS